MFVCYESYRLGRYAVNVCMFVVHVHMGSFLLFQFSILWMSGYFFQVVWAGGCLRIIVWNSHWSLWYWFLFVELQMLKISSFILLMLLSVFWRCYQTIMFVFVALFSFLDWEEVTLENFGINETESWYFHVINQCTVILNPSTINHVILNMSSNGWEDREFPCRTPQCYLKPRLLILCHYADLPFILILTKLIGHLSCSLLKVKLGHFVRNSDFWAQSWQSCC